VAPAAASQRRRTPHRLVAAAGALAAVAAGVLAVEVVVAPPAGAHFSDPTVHPVIDAVDPAVPGVTVQLAASVTAQLVVANPTPTPVSVLDPNDEPFLRIGPDGVFANKASAWWYLTNSPNGDATVPPDAHRGAPARWEQVSAEPAWGWFEHRLHPTARHAPADIVRTHKTTTLARWSVPFSYGGEPFAVTGRIVYQPIQGAVSARLRGPAQPFPDVGVQLAPGRVPALFLVNRGAEPVVVTGRAGEPFLRLGPNGAEVNRHSPTWVDDARAQGQDLAAAAAVVDPTAPPEWAPVTASPGYSWLEFRGLYERDRPPRRVVDAGKTAVLHAWAVPLEQAGRRVELRGETLWKPVSRPGG
jgi:hypothetical protein